MSEEEIYVKLTTIFHDVFDNDDLVLSPELMAEDVPDWDSLNHVRLILTVVREFHVQFSAAEITELKNVGDLVALLERKMLVASGN